MTFDEAREALLFHCSSDQRIDDPRWREGFLATLRPYAGLRTDVMEDVRQCFEAVRGHLESASALDRDVVNSLWGILFLGRMWALEPDGMLRSNGLISDSDLAVLKEWLEALAWDFTDALDGAKRNDA